MDRVGIKSLLDFIIFCYLLVTSLLGLFTFMIKYELVILFEKLLAIFMTKNLLVKDLLV